MKRPRYTKKCRDCDTKIKSTRERCKPCHAHFVSVTLPEIMDRKVAEFMSLIRGSS